MTVDFVFRILLPVSFVTRQYTLAMPTLKVRAVVWFVGEAMEA